MEHVPTETKEPVEEKHTPIIIKSERITLGYLGKDGYYHETKEEAHAATSLETKAQLLINDTIEKARSKAAEAQQAINESVKKAMINLAFKKALQGGQQGLRELELKLQNLRKKKSVDQIIHTPGIMQRWKNSQLKRFTPTTDTPIEQTPVPLKQYATRSNAILLKQNQYLEQTSRPAEPLDQDTRSNEVSLAKTSKVVATAKATIAKVLRYNKSAKSLL